MKNQNEKTRAESRNLRANKWIFYIFGTVFLLMGLLLMLVNFWIGAIPVLIGGSLIMAGRVCSKELKHRKKEGITDEVIRNQNEGKAIITFGNNRSDELHTYVAGTSYREDVVKSLYSEMRKSVEKEDRYEGMTAKEMKEEYEDGDKIYEIDCSNAEYSAYLEKEPENKADKNAIRVMTDINGKFVQLGYVRKELCIPILERWSDIEDVILYPTGGKYKEITEEFNDKGKLVKNVTMSDIDDSTYTLDMVIYFKKN